MPFRSEVRLNKLIDQALHEPEILDAFAKSGVTENFIRTFIKKDADKAWSMAVADIEAYDNAEKIVSELDKELQPMRLLELQSDDYKRSLKNLTLPVFLLVVIILLSVWIGYFPFDTATFFSTKIDQSKGFLENKLPFLVKLLSVLFSAFLIRHLILVYKLLLIRKRLDAWGSNQLMVFKKNQLEQNKLILTAAGNIAELNIIDKHIKEKIREKLNSFIFPSYNLVLNPIDAPGLAEIIDPSNSVDTAAKLHVDFLLENMPGGSIGIAGSRGAGKSTLVNMYCGNSRVIQTINEKKILPVMSSAPVHYDPRDFILHLFAVTCQSFLRNKGMSTEILTFFQKQNQAPSHYKKNIFIFYKNLLPVCGLLGLALFSFGLFSALHLADFFPVQQGEQLPEISSTIRVLKLLDVQPGKFIFWGLVLMVLVSIEITRRISQNDNENRNQDDALNQRGETISVDMIQLARTWLRKIKFQQSFTNGWAGSLKLPIGLEGELNSAITFAEYQLSNPEIVAGFTDFLQKLPPEYITIIGIDELDKIETDEKAQLFLNEIKSIFGLPRCFFLISVSENAMSSFERRGLPFRDVFDSSFDHIVYVDYLNLDTAIALLQRRVIGKPVPYFCLSYCLSGGLPRDLIRHFREIVKISKLSSGHPNISEVCRKLMKEEYTSKIRAIGFTARKIQALPETDPFFAALADFEANTGYPPAIKEIIVTLNTWRRGLQKRTIITENNRVPFLLLFKLCEELCTYSYFIDSVLALFSKLTEPDFQTDKTKEQFGKLAKAKQALSLDHVLAVRAINEVREVYQLETYFKYNLSFI